MIIKTRRTLDWREPTWRVPAPAFSPLSFGRLRPDAALDDFAAALTREDVWGRFGRLVVPERIAPMLAPAGPGFQPIGAWRGGVLAGAALLADLGGGACEYAVVVRSDLQRRGIGLALTRRAAGRAVAAGQGRLLAHVRADNGRALSLLRRCGFARDGATGAEMTFVLGLEVGLHG
ncbi:GNAT family N-acetyltransferase [Zavarzinia sp.]|uniref:GNAT family N-acetyltransferase n=1 Tax=Zavarzinia sp. TaxID=2027920 RepID=UPI003563D04C